MLLPMIITLAILPLKGNASPVTIVDSESGRMENQIKETTPDNLMSIATHLRRDPSFPLQDFEPEVLRALVSNPQSLEMLPKEVLINLLNDPIFSVHLPTKMLDKLSRLIHDMKNKAGVAEDEVNRSIDDYYDYDYLSDTDEDLDGMVGSFLSDLKPEFLKKLSPDLILAYFENASPADMEAIFKKSTLLQSLSSETIATVLKKLPEELFITLAKSDGVKELFTRTDSSISEEEERKLDEIQNVLATQLLDKLTARVITALPDYLLRSQLTNAKALKALLNHPEKLQALAESNPHLLGEIPIEVIDQIVTTERNVLGKLPTSVFKSFLARDKIFRNNEFFNELLETHDDDVLEKLLQDDNVENLLIETATKIGDNSIPFLGEILQNATVASRLIKIIPCSLLRRMSKSFKMIKNFPQIDQQLLVQVVATRPEVVDCISDEAFLHFLAEISDDGGGLSSVPESTLKTLVTSLPEEVVLRLANNKVLIENLPSSALVVAVKIIPKHLQQRLAVHSNVLSYLPDSAFGILSEEPAVRDIVGSLFPSELASIIRHNPRLMEGLSSRKLISLISTSTIIDLAGREDFIKLLPIDIMTDLFNSRPELVNQIPASVAVQLIRARPDAIQKIPQKFLKSLVLRTDILSTLTENDAKSLVMNLSLDQLKLMGEDETIILNIPHRFIVNAAKIRPKLISSIRPKILLSLAKSRFIIENLPASVIVVAAREMSEATMLQLLESGGHILSQVPKATLKALLQEPEITNRISSLSPLHLSLIMKQNPDILSSPTISSKLISLISAEALVKLSEMEDVIDLIPDSMVLLLINTRPDVVHLIPGDLVVKLVRSRPNILEELPLNTLQDLTKKRSDVIFELTENDLSSFVRIRPELVLLARSLPTHVLVSFLDNNIELVNLMPQEVSPYLISLVKESSLISRIPTRLIAKLAGVGSAVMQRIVDKDAVIEILKIHPDLPAIIDPHAVEPFLKFLEDSHFIERLPCEAIVAATRAPELLDLVSDEVLGKLATSSKVLRCIPGDILEELMESSNLQSRLPFSTMLRGARNLPLRKMSLSLAYTFLSSQMSQTHEVLSDY